MLEEWLKEIKRNADPDQLGMILAHNGVVRATSRQGKPVRAMRLSFDKRKLEDVVRESRQKEGIIEVKAWINQGDLKPGDDIMFLMVAGRFRSDVLPVFEQVLAAIKNEIVSESELP
jgi:molybdopterin synthase catalytic subunit